MAQRMQAGEGGSVGGSIINVSTAGSLRPGIDDLPCAMAKAGLNALTLALAGSFCVELSPTPPVSG